MTTNSAKFENSGAALRFARNIGRVVGRGKVRTGRLRQWMGVLVVECTCGQLRAIRRSDSRMPAGGTCGCLPAERKRDGRVQRRCKRCHRWRDRERKFIVSVECHGGYRPICRSCAADPQPHGPYDGRARL